MLPDILFGGTSGSNPMENELTQQETQGSFEFVGTEDILTKSLDNAEHSGRLRGQSKFVKHAQYFNAVNISRENPEVSYMKRQLTALEKTVQELCVKHGINREMMAEEATAPTLISTTVSTLVAPSMRKKPTHRISRLCLMLAKGNVRVTISVPKLKRALFPIPTNEATYIEEAVGGAGRKKLQSQPEVQQQTKEEVPTFDFSDIPVELRPLAYYAQSSLSDGTQIACPQQSVDGDDMPIYIGYEDVYHFITFKEISASSIMVYISGQHWILTVINPWDNSVLYFNPLGNDPDEDFQQLITLALNDWKLLVGRGITKRRNCQTLIQTAQCPIQQGTVQYGYFVLGFMREITLTVDGLALLQNKTSYTEAELNLVRQEWTTYVMCFIQY
ncbi:hypothetical protein TIFTF001_052748 [Ficus carica]|uniref:Ubiquitin-like protease family profile domain-containing protein n=1 Tax=Ficus carica TaxID=3494 RepID=A0AA88EDI6_FICCA|nr:hypothetical protein TIFTF001_052748 [Ficus carica]